MPEENPPSEAVPMQAAFPAGEEWEIDGEDFLLNPVFEPEADQLDANHTTEEISNSETKHDSNAFNTKSKASSKNNSNALPSTIHEEKEPPPTVEQIVEAMLFIGGPPLTFEVASQVVRGLTSDLFTEIARQLTKKYKSQNRPYSLQAIKNGYSISIKSQYASLREKIYGGPREARLSQPALDLLALIAYRQPISKSDIDAIRGNESATQLRQLVRLGLIAVSKRKEADETIAEYSTTNRFLEMFQLSSIDDLPNMGEPNALA